MRRSRYRRDKLVTTAQKPPQRRREEQRFQLQFTVLADKNEGILPLVSTVRMFSSFQVNVSRKFE